jgi:hypothetical protein
VSIFERAFHSGPRVSDGHGAPRRLGRAGRIAIVAVVAVSFAVAGRAAYALFLDQNGVGSNALTAGRIFPGTWTTPAFGVTDASSGSEVDASSPFAYAGDGLASTTKAWATTFDTGRYFDVDLNAPLPAGLGTTGVTFELDVASGAAGQTTCTYFEVRRQSTGAVLGTFGSSGSPVGCVTGTTPATVSASITSAVSTTDLADDLRVRVYMKNSGGGPAAIDRAVVPGSSPYAAFILYPVSTTDAADGTPVLLHWALAGP